MGKQGGSIFTDFNLRRPFEIRARIAVFIVTRLANEKIEKVRFKTLEKRTLCNGRTGGVQIVQRKKLEDHKGFRFISTIVNIVMYF